MTIADLQSISCFQGWQIVPRRGPRLALTPRERQILEAMLAGRTQKEIAVDLGLSSGAVRLFVSRGMRKLGRTRNARPTEVDLLVSPTAAPQHPQPCLRDSDPSRA